MIEVSGLRKEFGEVTAVAGVSFTAQPAEIFGLLGPNGAGKTTTLSCICGLIPPTSGQVRARVTTSSIATSQPHGFKTVALEAGFKVAISASHSL